MPALNVAYAQGESVSPVGDGRANETRLTLIKCFMNSVLLTLPSWSWSMLRCSSLTSAVRLSASGLDEESRAARAQTRTKHARQSMTLTHHAPRGEESLGRWRLLADHAAPHALLLREVVRFAAGKCGVQTQS